MYNFHSKNQYFSLYLYLPRNSQLLTLNSFDMPRLFTYSDFAHGSDIVRAYADKHTPVVVCATEVRRDEPFTATVRIGTQAKHPNTEVHHFVYIQLWNLETLIGEATLNSSVLGSEPLQIEVPFEVVPTVSMRLTALVYCNKHGLWRSEEVFVKVTD